MNPYDELGVAPDADAAEINAASRRKARASHPDAGGDPEAFARLSRAVAILRDPAQRERYDRTGQTEPAGDERTAAIEVLIQCFMGALGSVPNPNVVDVTVAAKAAIRDLQQSLKVDRSVTLKAQRDTARALDRLGFNGTGPDFIRKALDDQAAAISRNLDAIEARERVLTEALALADKYDWRSDQPPMQGSWFHISQPMTGGTTIL